MAKTASVGYSKLVVDENWATYFYLVPPEWKVVKRDELNKYPRLDPAQCYDVKLPNGTVFTGCEIRVQTHHTRGMGGMSEDSSSSEAFFLANGLEIKLKSGFLLRPNKTATTRRRCKLEDQKQENMRKDLLTRREEIDRKLADL
ncbi:MAG: hypothetical protein A2655_03645 [Candidatus Yanofskybacteria bacterium RIFCSPHIGHO2_01_FULL_43_42]|uniref:Uncharacterized protein n=1 Tax=Candidatus Yanofskybacteria bacterium RIFCSPLOWO2_01_FULL_43_22 TaxID=1802695 RepID=A0A1F8GF97_9BACT|nr:MAG: hypothetical protein A2655_03645 [Candidatus Yanofskybacteria bacterium RIFCSPHIGHO2_01_FULL_43_42]OGN12926.1 MAG: hypothetical protein A3D48_03370 [Candidatus Yanofskybacteria bacterium RIFCSPHIGHO2_02_FULL_43_17]OGN23993.1 MAG: hypothetical protein A3A13_02885 [Candidatus Yanofskybacteria bacterium RIFCSPLOWO2_01_FULL_43_22]